MKLPILSLSAAAAALVITAAIFSSTNAPVHAAQQAAPPPPPQPPPAQHQQHPAPTNLQVLPKTLTGEQVHEIMHKWEAAVGGTCGTCHAADTKNPSPGGRPRLNFADDSKPEKATARKMYLMVEDINKNYIAKIDNSGDPVTCGTCHQGHLSPRPFKAVEGEDHDHPAAPKN